MELFKTPENLTKVKRNQHVEFMNIGTKTEKKWAIIGVGITDKSIDYNAEKTEEKWIIHENTTKEIDSYNITSGVEQTAYKGDPVFEKIDLMRYRLATGSDLAVEILDVDTYSAKDEGATPKYRARVWDAIIEITSADGDTSKISYTINYNGDPKFGYVTISEKEPTFVEETAVASLLQD